MIKPAQLYAEELKRLYCETWYDSKYMYYRSYVGTEDLHLPDNNYEHHTFAILENNEVIGYVTYKINWAARVVYNFGIISFKQSLVFGKDLLKIIDDIFIKYNMNKIEFWAYQDNPAIKHYYKFINKFGGREVGILKQTCMLMDGKLHDSVMFELFLKDYLFYKKFPKLTKIKKDSILKYNTETYIISEK